jgi:hypothetical protein
MPDEQESFLASIHAFRLLLEILQGDLSCILFNIGYGVLITCFYTFGFSTAQITDKKYVVEDFHRSNRAAGHTTATKVAQGWADNNLPHISYLKSILWAGQAESFPTLLTYHRTINPLMIKVYYFNS